MLYQRYYIMYKNGHSFYFVVFDFSIGPPLYNFETYTVL